MGLTPILIAVLLASPAAAPFELSSPVIREGAVLARAQVHADCGGGNVAPALSWSGAPAGTRSFAVTLFDPDAKGGWWHWTVYDIPATAQGLPSGGALPPGARAGLNDFGQSGYGGACPPPGSGSHRYRFTVWAMGTAVLPLEGAEEDRLIAAYLETHALARATLTAVYGR